MGRMEIAWLDYEIPDGNMVYATERWYTQRKYGIPTQLKRVTQS